MSDSFLFYTASVFNTSTFWQNKKKWKGNPLLLRTYDYHNNFGKHIWIIRFFSYILIVIFINESVISIHIDKPFFILNRVLQIINSLQVWCCLKVRTLHKQRRKEKSDCRKEKKKEVYKKKKCCKKEPHASSSKQQYR